MRLPILALGLTTLVLASACSVEPESEVLAKPKPPITACNGSAALCDRPLNEVVFLTAHNAMSNEEEGWLPPNHEYPIPRQLADGVRGLSLDIHPDPKNPNGPPILCHSICSLGSAVLGDTLAVVRQFLRDNPHEVIVIMYETYVDGAASSPVFETSGLAELAYAHTAGAPWPTLRTLLEAGQQVVIFTQDGGGDRPWNHLMWDYIWDNSYSYEKVEDFDCAVGRGKENNQIFSMNHFLTAPLAAPELAQEANRYEVLMQHVERCLDETGKLPTFLWVDFYATGDAMRVVNELNAGALPTP